MGTALKHAVILAHPRAESFTGSVADSYIHAVEALGHNTQKRDLYRMGFDPRLKAAELPFAPDFAAGADVQAERVLLEQCQVFAFFYPLWLNAPPAILKGYLERVFGFGFAYGDGRHSAGAPRLTGRSLISFSSSGGPTAWLQKTGSLPAVEALFDTYFVELCGLGMLGHFHFGAITPGASDTFIAARLQEVSQIVGTAFGHTS
jgi:NAD(P)H dehydrogenase (quinone)